MKRRISATIEEKTREIIEKLLDDTKYRNMSHVIEKALEALWKRENVKKKR